MAGLALSGCVAAVPVAPSLTVIPGQGKTAANLQADDAVCRGQQSGPRSSAATVAAAPAVTVTADQYYACMASRGEYVVEETPQVSPAVPGYAAYAGAYPAFGYPTYGYPPYAYPYYPYGWGYPYSGAYFGPYVGFGIGFGYGRFYGGHGWYGGYGGWHGGGWHGGGWHGGGWHGGGWGGGWHGGGGFRGGGFHR